MTDQGNPVATVAFDSAAEGGDETVISILPTETAEGNLETSEDGNTEVGVPVDPQEVFGDYTLNTYEFNGFKLVMPSTMDLHYDHDELVVTHKDLKVLVLTAPARTFR